MIRFNAVGAFPLLTEQDENVQDAFELGIVPPLVELLATEQNVLVLQNAAQALGNIAEGHAEYQKAICESQGLDRLCDVINKWSPAPHGAVEAPHVQKWDRANRQELLAKCCFAVWLICQKNEANQIAFSEAGGISELVRLLVATNEETLLEMSAGAVCAICEACDQNKARFREDKGLEPLINLLEHPCDTVKLNAAKALCHLSESHENRKIVRELGGLDKIVKLLAH